MGNKALIVADIHINDYTQRNPSNFFRLYQGSRTVAQNIIKVGKQEGCNYIIFAGDVVEKCILRPYVMAEVKSFLDTIMSNFEAGFIIYGNHCMDGKSNDQTISDSFLGLILPPNLHYAHQKSIQLGNTSVAFSNWMPEFDLSWIKTPVDVLVTHAKICYSGEDAAGLFESQKLDESKFDLAICGDIHRAAQLGKYVSIGVPQKCKMGDSDDSTGVVLDLDTKNWKWVDLNPDDNLMKMAYTSVLEEEGWKEDIHTWMVYKRDNSSLIGSGTDTKIGAWDEINELINEAIYSANLQDVHSEVVKNISNIDAGEVDFNFVLLWLHCKNWRSIDEATLNFNDGDRILIQGVNGSGKSSLLSALKYAFVDVSDTTGLSSLKPFIQFGSKECYTEVEFLYQGNLCKIKRGTKDYGLWINKEQMKYPSKRDFENDVRARFPFIKYMDSFFLDSDHNTFIGSLSPEREIEIVSKFLKLDRLDTYNETAKLLSEQFRKESYEWNTKITETQKILNYINEKLAAINVPSVSKAELEQRKREGLELQRKNNEWNRFVNSTARLQAQIQNCESKIEELNNERMTFRDQSVIDYEISEINKQIANLQNSLVELGNIRVNYDYKNRELTKLINEGNNAWKEAQSIGINSTCPTCGQTITTPEALENHKRELLQKVEELRPTINNLKAEVAELESLKNNSDEEYRAINKAISDFNVEVSKRMTEKSHQNSVNSDITKYMRMMESATNELNSLGVVEKVELPDNFMSVMSDIESGIVSWNLLESSQLDKYNREQELASYIQESERIFSCLAQLDEYIKLTGPVGVIYEAIMNKLKTQFSDNTVNYEVVRKGKGAKEHLSLNPQFKLMGNWVDYTACSAGQRTFLDIHFLSRIVTRLGLLVLDEFLKHLDPSNHDSCLDMIKDMNIGCTMISSHMESITAFNNKSCTLSLNNSGMTQIDFK